MASKFKKNDSIIVISGSSKGKIGRIINIKNDSVTIEGVNIATIHKKPTQSESGSIVKKEKPIHISNIAHNADGKAVKIGFKTSKNSDGKIVKVRYSKKAEIKFEN